MEALKAPIGVGSREGYPSLQFGGCWAPKSFDFVLRNVEIYAFWTLDEQEDSTATVIMMLQHTLHFQRRKKYVPGG